MTFRWSVSLLLGAMLSVGLLSAADVVQPIGSATSFWTLQSEPAGATETIGGTPFRYFNGAYYPDNSLSGWVSPTASGNAGVGGNYVYQLTVDLTGLNPATAVITGTFGTDNDGSISLNGNAAVATTCFACFGAATSFTFNSGFVAGQNFIRVTVNNGGDPTAFRVEFSTATSGASPITVHNTGTSPATTQPPPVATPIPPSILLTLTGLMGLGLFEGLRRLRRA